MKRKFNKLVIFFFFFSLFLPISVLAGSASISLSGGTVGAGENVTVSINLNSVSPGTLQSFGGYLNYDSNYLDLVSCSSSSTLGLSFNSANKKLAFISTSGTGISSGAIGTCTFTTKTPGSTSVSISSVEATNDSENLAASLSPASVTIKEPPSGNNNLASLSVNVGTINFSPGNTNYSLSVDSKVSSVNVTGTAEDPKSSVSGLGSRNLNYGNNAIQVVVTAENGNKKTYTVNINRKDDRSNNNNLASLTVSNGTLNPGFSKSTVNYTMEVPYDVSKLDLSAKAEDSKATVNINNPELVAEETTDVTVTVTAENGSSKTYTISVKRGKDPNKALSDNNYLASLTVDIGILSPVFDKEKTNYAVYLPFEVTEINIEAIVEDTKYATIKVEGDSKLNIGNNLFKYTVTAEDGSTRTYTVTVVRNKSLEDLKKIDNTFLKKLELSNGKLVKKFNKKDQVIYYKKTNKKVSIKEAIPEIEENEVSTYKIDKGFIIIVETSTGERGFYLLLEQSSSSIVWIILPIIIVLGGCGVFFYLKRKKNLQENPKKNKK